MTVEREEILVFENVLLRDPDREDLLVEGASFRLSGGDCLLVDAMGLARQGLADAAQGLLEPERGEIRFEGTPWKRLSPERFARARYHVGRVFAEGGWLSNLNADENVTLATRYHTPDSDELVEEAALAVAQELGMDDLPRGRPAFVQKGVLLKAQWVRALLGDKSLLVLEEPTTGIGSESTRRLVSRLKTFREKGGAVLWLTADRALLSDEALAPTGRMRIEGNKLVPLD